MFAKIGSFFEEHIEKVILAFVGLVCIWLVVTRVLISPNVVTYNNKKYSPRAIDQQIREASKELELILNQPPDPALRYISKLSGPLDPNDPVREGIYGDLQNGFDGLLASAINGVDTHLSLPIPANISTEADGGREYALTLAEDVIGDVQDVAVQHFRAAAYVPTLPVTEDVTYENAAAEPNDIDFVTVEAKFDVEQLYEKFFESFAGEDVPKEWRDPCLAVPVFAAVQLQRQELLDDGSWSDWRDVSRSSIDHRKRMFEIIENIESLPPGGTKVRLLQFNEPEVRMDLLQPQAYQIASANQEWFPPSLYKKFVELQKKEKLEQRRGELEEQKEEKQREREQMRDDRRGGTFGTGGYGGGAYSQGYGGMESGTRATRTRGSRDSRRTGRGNRGLSDNMGYGEMGDYGQRQRRPTRSRGRTEYNPDLMENYPTMMEGRGIKRGPTVDDVYYDFQEASLTPRTDLSKWREPLMFWVHDDTVEEGKSYRYRIRLGVYNPAAGTNQLDKQDKSLKDKVILWSKFSDATEQVEIPRMLYFFAKDIQEAAKKITIQVSKYVLGYWYSEDFSVRQGEVIGKLVESEIEEPRDRMRNLRYGYGYGYDYVPPQEQTIEPEEIDYSTGAVLVDAVVINDWSGAGQLRPRQYFDVLYSYDGTNIEHMPVKPGNWSAELLEKFNEINSAQREPKEQLRAWDSKLSGPRRLRAPGREGYEGDPYGEEYDMMMEEMMMMEGYGY